jgi:hypothetical protein
MKKYSKYLLTRVFRKIDVFLSQPQVVQYGMPQDPQDHDVAALANKTSPSGGQIFSSLITALKLEKFVQKKPCYDYRIKQQ